MELRQEHSEDAKRCRMQSAGGISSAWLDQALYGIWSSVFALD